MRYAIKHPLAGFMSVPPNDFYGLSASWSVHLHRAHTFPTADIAEQLIHTSIHISHECVIVPIAGPLPNIVIIDCGD